MLVKILKFLLIDDDPFVLEKLIESLKLLDFEGPFTCAKNGEEALQLLKGAHSSTFDFIICDIYMPKVDGISFLSRLKSEQLLEEPTPILMLTAENDRKVVVECIKLGATNYLLKPWTQPELARKIVAAWEKIHAE